MLFNIDVAIIIVFLVINLTLGIWSGSGIKTIKDYAIGNRDFSTATLAATIIATWISGSFFTICVTQTYKEGVWFLPSAMGAILSLFIIGYVFAPRMKEFFGSLSVAETMGDLFGKHVRIITAVCAIAQAVAMTALQIKVFSTVFSYFFHFSSTYATCVSSIIVIFYSAWGGIKAVTFTDVIQFFTFGIFVPLFLVFITKTLGGFETTAHVVQTSTLLDYSELFNWNDPKFFPNLFMFLWMLTPTFNSTTFQRILMNKSTQQIKQSFTIAGLGYGAIVLLSCAIGAVVLSLHPGLEPNNVIIYILDNYSFDGLRGITLIGIMAMIMSSADSWINSGAVIFAHDLCKPLGIKFKDELFLSRIFAVVGGFGALLLVLYNSNLLKLFSLQANFYVPIVTVPLILAIFGFRSSARAVILGMLSGAICVVIWKIYVQPATGVDSVIPSMFANLVVLILSHYILGEPGGYVGIKDDSDLMQIRRERSAHKWVINGFFNKMYNTNIIDYCRRYLPKNEMTYIYFALAVMTTMVTTLLLDNEIYKQNMMLVNVLQGAALLVSMIFLLQKLWPNSVKVKFLGIIWYLSIFFGLAFISSFLTLISKFSPVSVAVLILNLTIIGLLMSWQATFLMVVLSMSLALFSYICYMGSMLDFVVELHDIKLNIFYILCAIIGLLLTFLKPKQEHAELLEEKNSYLEDLMRFKDAELQKAIDLKYEFLRNLEHESHTPITGITSLGQVLWESYDLLSEQQRRQGLEDIAKSGERLSTLVNNMIDLSKLSSLSYALDLQKINFSKLVIKRVETCKKLYLKGKDLEFILDVGEEIILQCDNYYITRVLDNLIVNAIGYSASGKIVAKLSQNKNIVEFSIKDEGVGIPALELHDIFGAFVVSSKTHTPAGGRGVGLALCKNSIAAHGGKIWSESDGKHGATFIFTIPVK